MLPDPATAPDRGAPRRKSRWRRETASPLAAHQRLAYPGCLRFGTPIRNLELLHARFGIYLDGIYGSGPQDHGAVVSRFDQQRRRALYPHLAQHRRGQRELSLLAQPDRIHAISRIMESRIISYP